MSSPAPVKPLQQTLEHQELNPDQQAELLSRLVEFRENPWYSHFIAKLRVRQQLTRDQVFGPPPNDLREEKLREQLMGAQRDLEVFWQEVENTYNEITYEQQRKQRGNIDDERSDDRPDPAVF